MPEGFTYHSVIELVFSESNDNGVGVIRVYVTVFCGEFMITFKDPLRKTYFGWIRADILISRIQKYFSLDKRKFEISKSISIKMEIP